MTHMPKRMPLVDIIHRICVAKRSAPDTPCAEPVTLFVIWILLHPIATISLRARRIVQNDTQNPPHVGYGMRPWALTHAFRLPSLSGFRSTTWQKSVS